MAVLTDEIERLVRAEHWDPFSILGPQPADDGMGTVVRAFLPEVAAVSLLPEESDGQPVPMRAVHDAGLYEARLPHGAPSRYRLRVTDRWGNVSERHDPYAFSPFLSDFDLHLFAEGRQYRAYDRLGAHLRTVEGVTGVHFAVWAPNARRVSVVGDFNSWDGRRHAMRSRGATGLWELFIPELPEGTLY